MSQEIPESAEFMMRLMSAMHTSTTATVDSLWRSSVESERRHEAALQVVRETVNSLLSGPYMPHPYAIERALYPSSGEVTEMAVHLYGENWTDPTSSRIPFCCSSH